MKQYFRFTEQHAGIGGKGGKHSTVLGKISRLVICVMLSMTAITFSGCPETDLSDEELIEKGKQAAADFCKCAKNKSKDDCLDELNAKYSKSVYKDSKFIDAFNDAQTCNTTLKLED